MHDTGHGSLCLRVPCSIAHPLAHDTQITASALLAAEQYWPFLFKAVTPEQEAVMVQNMRRVRPVLVRCAREGAALLEHAQPGSAGRGISYTQPGRIWPVTAQCAHFLHI